MKLMNAVWYCRRLHQFILVDCCEHDSVSAFRLLKLGVRLFKILIISTKIGLHCTRLKLVGTLKMWYDILTNLEDKKVPQ